MRFIYLFLISIFIFIIFNLCYFFVMFKKEQRKINIKQELDNSGYYVALNDNANFYLTDKQYEELNRAIEKGEKTYTFKSEYILDKNLFVFTIFLDKICCITNAKENN